MGNCSDLHVIVSNPADGTYTFPAETGLGITQSGNYMGTFTAAADSVELRFQMPAMPSGADTGYFWLDDVWVDEVIPYDGGGVSGSDDGYRYGFNGKENDNEVKGEGNQQDYGMRIYDPRLGRFLSSDPLTSKFAMLTPYQFASNRPIDGIDLDGLEFFKKDNTSYRLEYKPVINASDVGTGVGNAVHNALSFVWNGTFGAVLEGEKGINNYFAGGYKDPTPDIIPAFDNWQNSLYRYHTQTPIKQQLKDFGNAATDLHNYEILPSLIIAHQFTFSSAAEISMAKLPSQGEIFTNSIATRSSAESYAAMTEYKRYFNANDFIKANNPAFDLISTIEKNVVDVATTSKTNLKISSWETNKLKRLSKFRPQGYSSTLQMYVKEGQYTEEQLANYRKSLNDYISGERLKNVDARVDEIPKGN